MICIIEGCERLLRARGWCITHYTRWWKTGKVESTKPVRQMGREGCLIEACNKQHYARGLCYNHYQYRVAIPKRRAQREQAEICDFTYAQWLAKLKEYDNHCAYCDNKFRQLEQEHIIPLSKGGNHTASNIVPACRSCNVRKRNSVGKYFPIQRDRNAEK